VDQLLSYDRDIDKKQRHYRRLEAA
jgi:hypothetical protein